MERSNTIIGSVNVTEFGWDNVTEADTPDAQKVPSGRYSYNVEGAFGGATFELKYSKNGTTFHSIDVTNLTLAADGTYNLEIGEGFLKPVRTGGASTDVDIRLIPIAASNR